MTGQIGWTGLMRYALMEVQHDVVSSDSGTIAVDMVLSEEQIVQILRAGLFLMRYD